ncbi:putative Zn-dependent peptidase [Desulfomonile tiedjei DSM 6799]|uniref:Putative Zn-dependent peptidase n=1 Tax=Desulfomonile tiedjei (strain ATCC 49306 / DSM 6799 / DCB-1) TaxID=706587 RepID=I4CCL4_DESTA|nr:putative Zn-dependent peptidase [Desulfomonile tiedjei DSM 6799]
MAYFAKIRLTQAWLIGLLFLLILPCNVYAQEDDLKHFTLPNGLDVFVKEDHARKVATIQIWVKVGSADEELSELGISHLIEHMAFKGTEKRGVGQIASELEALGGETNAYTSWDETVFHVTVPSTGVSQGLDILTDAVFRPSIDPDELNKEKQVVIEEILEGEERPERKASKLLFHTAYEVSPYKYPIIGYKDVVAGFTRDNIIQFRKKWYVPENMFMVIVGDIDPNQVRTDLEKYTADLKQTGFFRPPRPSEPVQKEIRGAVLRDRNSRETRLYVAFHIPSLSSPDVNAIDLMADILGARDSSRLVQTLKKDKGLVNSISAYALTPKKPGLFAISATLDGKNLETVTKGIMEEVAKLQKQPPSAEELDRAKTHIESQHIYARETVQGMARSIGSFEADLGDASYEEKYLNLNRLITPEQISATAKKYLTPPNVTVTVLIPEDVEQDFQIEKLTGVVKHFGASQTAQTAAAGKEAAAIVRTFPNGLKVVLQPDNSNPAVSFRIAMMGGKRFETKETEGIMNFISQMLDKGTSKMSEQEIAQKVEDMGGRLNGFSGYDSFGVYATFFSRNTDEGLEMLARIYTDPAFPEDKLERERNLIINRIKTEPDRPVQYTVNVLNQTVFKDHPYGFVKEGTLATVAGFTADDLKQTYERFAVPANTVITGVGALDPEKTMARIEQLFGKLEARQFVPPVVPAEEPIAKVRENVVQIPRAKAHIAIGFRGVSVSDEDRYPLEVLNNILAGQGGRLFLQLRDKESLAYVVTSFVRPAVEPGLFGLYIATEPSKADTALKGLFRELEQVKSQPVNGAELERSITNLIGNHLISLQSSWNRAENSALNTLYGLGYDYDKEYIAKVSKVTSDDVMRVARKYLELDHCAIVKIMPEKDA